MAFDFSPSTRFSRLARTHLFEAFLPLDGIMTREDASRAIPRCIRSLSCYRPAFDSQDSRSILSLIQRKDHDRILRLIPGFHIVHSDSLSDYTICFSLISISLTDRFTDTGYPTCSTGTRRNHHQFRDSGQSGIPLEFKLPLARLVPPLTNSESTLNDSQRNCW